MFSESLVSQVFNYVYVYLNDAYLRVDLPEATSSTAGCTPETPSEGMAIASTNTDSIVARLAQPNTVIAAACLSLSLVVLCSFWRSGRGKIPVFIEEQPKSISDKKTAERTTETTTDASTPLSQVSALIIGFSSLLEQANKITIREEEDAITMSKLSAELPMTLAALCQIQQLLSLYHTILGSQPGLRTCFETILTGLGEIISNLDGSLATTAVCHCQPGKASVTTHGNLKSIETVVQQLRTQKEGLLFVIDSIQRINQETSSSSTIAQPPFQASSHTPGSDLKTFLESAPDVDELPEYSPPPSGEILAPDAKAFIPQPVEIDSHPVTHKRALSGSVTDIFNAIVNNEPETLDKLLVDEIDPNLTHGRLQRTPLHECARLNRVTCARVLLRHGALVDIDDGKGDAPLHLASWEGHVEVGSLLISSDADIDRLSGRDGYSPLWCAITGRQIDMARLLLKRGARISLKSPSEAFPVHQAAITAQTAMCELLLERGADVNCRDRDGNTPLHCSATIGDVRTAKLLLREKADVNARQERGLTPLHWAAHKNHPEMVSLLLENGANENSMSETFATPLHCAAARNHMTCAKLLIRRGADLSGVTTDWNGRHGTPLDLAARNGHREMVALLKRPTYR